MRYRTIVADPPWQFQSPTMRGAAERHYETMPLVEIGALPVRDLAEDDAHLYLWMCNFNAPEAWWISQAWGFQPITVITWCKPGPGVGYWFRNNTEHVLFATRGKPLGRDAAVMSTWFQWPRAEHSRKPEAFMDMVESLSPPPRLELFARRTRLGWDTWGNQALEHVNLSAGHNADKQRDTVRT